MKNYIIATVLAGSLIGAHAQVKQTPSHGYPITPVPFTSVKVTDDFWGQRLKASREVTIPLAFSKCEETGRYENFVKAAHPSDTYKVGGLAFDDTDVYKTIEGASYLLGFHLKLDYDLELNQTFLSNCNVDIFIEE